MKEELIMSLAENITKLMILSILFGLVVGWYFSHLYHIGKKQNDDNESSSHYEPLPRYIKPVRKRVHFINIENAGDNSTLNHIVSDLEKKGFVYNPQASLAGVLAFEKLEEAPRAEYFNELTDAEIDELRK